MAFTPTSGDAIPPWALANLVASTAEFQRAVGADDEAAALQSVYYLETDDRREGDGPKPHPRPRCIIEWAERMRNRSGTGLFTQTGILSLSFELLDQNLYMPGASSPPTLREMGLGFQEFYGLVLDQMETNVHTAPDRYLSLQEVALAEGPLEVREREENFWAVRFMVSWF